MTGSAWVLLRREDWISRDICESQMKRLGEGEGNEGRQKQYRTQPGDSDPEQEGERAADVIKGQTEPLSKQLLPCSRVEFIWGSQTLYPCIS